MNKTIINVFKVVGVLVIVFIGWQLLFNDGGVIKTAYNSLATSINKQWAKVAGDGEDGNQLLALWGDNAPHVDYSTWNIDV